MLIIDYIISMDGYESLLLQWIMDAYESLLLQWIMDGYESLLLYQWIIYHYKFIMH